jgi:hypothetical protein
MLKAILSALLITATPAAAGPDRWSILLGSKHVDAQGYNEVNPGLFATWEREHLHWSVGAYHNSYDRVSVAATAYLPMIEWKGGNAGPFAGLALYPKDGRNQVTHIGGDVIAIGGIQARHRNLFVQITPMDGKPVKALIAFGITWAVKP